MEEKFNAYLENLVQSCLQASPFQSFSQEQKNELAQKIKDHFYNVILDELVNNLNTSQLEELNNLEPESPQMEQKIMEYASMMPNLLSDIEKKLQQDASLIQQTGQIPQVS